MTALFCLVCAAFIVTAWMVSRNSKTHSLRYNDSGLNVVGLVTANITAGTGFVYLLINGAKNGLLACLLPLAMLLGYRTLCWLIDGVPAKYFEPNFLQGAANAISEETGTKSALPMVLILPLLVTFVLVLGFELFATSQLLSALLFSDNTVFHQLAIAAVLLVTTAIVVSMGAEATLKTEKLQAGLILLSVVALVVLAVAVWVNAPDTHATSFQLKTDGNVLVALAFAAVAGFNTQLYSILNWNAVASASPDRRRWVLTTSSYWLAAFVFIVILIGTSMPAVWGRAFHETLGEVLTTAVSSTLGLAIRVMLIVGIAAITLTTTQGVALAVGAFSQELRIAKDPRTSPNRAYVLMLCGVIVILGGIFFSRPDLFYLLLRRTRWRFWQTKS